MVFIIKYLVVVVCLVTTVLLKTQKSIGASIDKYRSLIGDCLLIVAFDCFSRNYV